MNKRILAVGCLTAATLCWVVVLSIASHREKPDTQSTTSGNGGTGRITLVDTSAFESSGKGEVRLRADLRDKTGKPVQGLSVEKIEVLEEGFPCRIDSLDGPGTQPINVVLVIDTSGSMADEGRIVAARSAASEAVNQLIPGRDRMGLISFADDFHVLVPFGPIQPESKLEAQKVVNGLETPDLLHAIAGLIAVGGTRIAEPTLAGVGMFGGKVDGAKLVIVMTDGEDDTLAESVERIGQEATKAGCKVFTIGFGSGVTPASSTVLKNLASSGNGQYYFAPDSATLAQIYKDQVQEAAEEFGIRISSPFPQADGLERRLTLKATTPLDGILTADSRYRVGSMISTVRADPVRFGDQSIVPADSGSGPAYSVLLGVGIACCLVGSYFLTRFLPSGDVGITASSASISSTTAAVAKKPLPPPPEKPSPIIGQNSGKSNPSAVQQTPLPATRKMPPPPPRKQ